MKKKLISIILAIVMMATVAVAFTACDFPLGQPMRCEHYGLCGDCNNCFCVCDCQPIVGGHYQHQVNDLQNRVGALSDNYNGDSQGEIDEIKQLVQQLIQVLENQANLNAEIIAGLQAQIDALAQRVEDLELNLDLCHQIPKGILCRLPKE